VEIDFRGTGFQIDSKAALFCCATASSKNEIAMAFGSRTGYPAQDPFKASTIEARHGGLLRPENCIHSSITASTPESTRSQHGRQQKYLMCHDVEVNCNSVSSAQALIQNPCRIWLQEPAISFRPDNMSACCIPVPWANFYVIVSGCIWPAGIHDIATV